MEQFGAKEIILIAFTVIMSLVAFIVNSHKKSTEKNFDVMFTKLDGLQTKEMCEFKHEQIDKDIDNIATVARGE